jgi:hypothetical protein
MGEVNQGFCDGCKKETGSVTYSKDGQTGVVKFRMAIWKEAPGLEGLDVDLCQSCHSKILAWIQGKANTAASDWNADAPAVKTLTPPNL